MEILSQIVIAFIALLHLYIMWFEMFAWTTTGRKIFKSMPPDLFDKTTTLAANQGLYNGFLAAGLIWSLFLSPDNWADQVAIFFLSCILVAGLYGAYSASKKIFFVQGLPALIGIVLVWLK